MSVFDNRRELHVFIFAAVMYWWGVFVGLLSALLDLAGLAVIFLIAWSW